MADSAQQLPGAAQRGVTQSVQRASARVKPGDATGREKARLQAEHTEEIRAQQERVTLISQVAEDQQQRGVFDPQTGDLIEELTVEEAAVFEGLDAIEDPGTIAVLPPVEAQTPTVRVTMLDEVEKMTYGSLNFPLLRAGYSYRLPVDVAEHLDQRGLIRKIG